MTESPGNGWNHDRNNDKDIDEILTKIRNTPHKTQQQEREQERAVWNVGQRLRRNMCVVCVCARTGAWGWGRGQPGNRLMF